MKYATRYERIAHAVKHYKPGCAISDVFDELVAGTAPELKELGISTQDFKICGELGTGQYGDVRLVRCLWNSQHYAIKIISKHKVSRAGTALNLPIERDIHQRASETSPIPRLFAAFQTDTVFYLVTELAENGCLADIIPIPESQIALWAGQMADAVEWVHQQGYAHRDIKPSNFIIGASGRILLTDFGSATLLDSAGCVAAVACQTPVGTPDYIAPEILRCAEASMLGLSCQYDHTVDLWSLGATLFEMAVGQPPYYADSLHETYDAIKNHKALNWPISLSKDLVLVLKSLLAPVGHRRTAPLKKLPGRGDNPLTPRQMPSKAETDWTADSSVFGTFTTMSVIPHASRFPWTWMPSPSTSWPTVLPHGVSPGKAIDHAALNRQGNRLLLSLAQQSVRKQFGQSAHIMTSMEIRQRLSDLEISFADTEERIQRLKERIAMLPESNQY